MRHTTISAGITAVVTALSVMNAAFALNPQPEPPGRPANVASQRVLAAQPLVTPRSVQKADLVGLNPQPEPPSRPVSRIDMVGLNPQPEPPSRTLSVPINTRGGIIQNRVGDVRVLRARSTDRSLSEMQFQNMTQKQSQVLQMMGNVSKSMHESSLSVVRNIK